MAVESPALTPKRLSLGNWPTPLVHLKELSKRIAPLRLWCKRDDLGDFAASGNKLRKLEFIVADALETGCDTLITCGGIQSNHCRATAAIGARLGLKVHLVLRDDEDFLKSSKPPAGNHLLSLLFGAEAHLLSVDEYQSDREAMMAQLAATHGDAYLIPTGGSDAVGIWGYASAVEELSRDCRNLNLQPRCIVCATGSGGTLAGLIAGAQLARLDSRVIGVNVCDDAEYFQRKILEDLNQWRLRYRQPINTEAAAIEIIEGYKGAGYGVADASLWTLIAEVAASEGLLLDPTYTAKAMQGILAEARKGAFGEEGDIIFIHSGGAFGLFARQREIGKVLNWNQR